jgi:hypothetical protein
MRSSASLPVTGLSIEDPERVTGDGRLVIRPTAPKLAAGAQDVGNKALVGFGFIE